MPNNTHPEYDPETVAPIAIEPPQYMSVDEDVSEIDFDADISELDLESEEIPSFNQAVENLIDEQRTPPVWQTAELTSSSQDAVMQSQHLGDQLSNLGQILDGNEVDDDWGETEASGIVELPNAETLETHAIFEQFEVPAPPLGLKAKAVIAPQITKPVPSR